MGDKSFDSILFWSVLGFCLAASIASTIFTISEDMGTQVEIYVIGITIYFLVILHVARFTKKLNACYFATLIAIHTLIVPPMFFLCGGFMSGMPFYCLTSFLVTALYRKPAGRIFLAATSLVVYEGIFWYVWKNPQSAAQVDPDAMILDIMVSFALMGVLIYTIVAFLMRAYIKEKHEKDKVIQQLHYNSSHDPLTALRNRRYFIQYLNNTIGAKREHFYLLMFDVDHFKKVNDTYGHLFGDQVLCEISKIAKNTRHVENGEIAVRYGGEEFIQLFYADSMDEAFERAEQMRHAISKITFNEFPNIQITVSGGLESCANPNFETHEKLLSSVDALLYQAKENGRNQIICGLPF